MRNRCSNPNNQAFRHYGGRGIVVCEAWLSFEPFRDWALANGYRDDLSIERRDNEGYYEPDNCEWIPLGEQWRNQRGDCMTTRAVIRSDGTRFNSVKDGASASKVTTSMISAAIKRGGKSGGYGWRYV
jgi:hypothetical protein